MTAKRRRALVEESILRLGEVDFASLAREFSVSEMTIRRDVDALEVRGIVRRVTGGVIALARKVAEPPFQARVAEASEEKGHIAEAVVAMLSAGETVVLDSGSTVLAVARAIRGRGLGLTVITPSVLAAVELGDEPDTTVILTGGTLRPGDLSLVGHDAADTFKRYNADTFVMGVAGVHPDRGFSDYHRGESAVKDAAMQASDRVIVAIDRSKLGRSTLVNIAPTTSVDVIVCDAAENDATVRKIRQLGVTVTCVPGGAMRPAQATDDTLVKEPSS
ncbi:DeoR/GlpR family DNA-binding transcription regulator [Acrocarpospora pleiomorpha]|nr:DeoR/GlpR family DNA-binding transcription regulator [Acrocarpospora pleiomorpha]